MAPSESTNRVHLLSKKSQRLERDTFFFIQPQGGLIAGLNQRLMGPISSAKLNRWARLCDPYCPPFELAPIKLEKFGILNYVSKPASDRRFPPESTASLPPGDYSWAQVFGSGFLPFGNMSSEDRTFADWNAEAERPGSHMKDHLPYNTFPLDLEANVVSRDVERRCFLTGYKDDVELTWVCPPAWSFCTDLTQYQDPKSMQNPSNAMFLRKDLIAAFYDNAFGIDVDDDYRIVVFYDFGPVREVLPEKALISAHRSAGTQGPDDEFLRLHFRHCLNSHLLGGDIHEDYSANDIQDAMEELGVDRGGEGDAVDFESPLWQTPLGKEIFEDYLKNLAALKEQESAGSDEDLSDSE